jgi:hypothetical protein
VVKPLCALLAEIALFVTAQALASSTNEGARDSALQWLQVVDSGNYNNATLMIAQELRGARDWGKYLADHRAPLGRIGKRQLADEKRITSIPAIPGARNYELLRFGTSFERKVIAVEEVTLLKTGCCWEVVDYKIINK